MTTLYSSIEAAEVRCAKPDHCKNCRRRHDWFTRHSKPTSVMVASDVREMYWMCDLCGYCNNSILYLNRHSQYSILTEEQSNWMVDQRWEKNLTLKVIAENTGISVGRLSDIERRHAAPTQDEWQMIKSALEETEELD